MKVLQVKEHNPPSGLEYMVGGYPGSGCWLTPAGMLTIINGGMIFTVMGAQSLITEAQGVGVAGGVSEAFVLKALAIAQNPQLAVELAK